jgi:hypothetical protein
MSAPDILEILETPGIPAASPVAQDRSFRNQRPAAVDQTPAARAFAGRNFDRDG